MTYYENNKQHMNNYKKNLFTLNVSLKKYYCDVCDKSCRDKQQLDRHMRSKKHNGYKRYRCPFSDCDYSNRSNYHLVQHLRSRQHRIIEYESD